MGFTRSNKTGSQVSHLPDTTARDRAGRTAHQNAVSVSLR